MASILLLDAEGKRLWYQAAPSLPPEFVEAIVGSPIGTDIGPCGTAAYLVEPIIVPDIALETRWERFRGLASVHGLRACWSIPIVSLEGTVLGAFAVYSRDAANPTPQQRNTIDQLVSLASVGIARSRTQAALQESEERFRQLADALPEVIWITALKPEKLLYVSPSFEKIWGLRIDALLADPGLWTSSIHPDDRERVRSLFTRWTQGHDVSYHNVEFRIVQPGGAIRWIHERGVLHRDDEGNPVRVSGISTDITDHKRSDEALRRSEAYQAEAQRLSLTGSFSWNLRTGEVTWSDEVYRIYGHDKSVKPTLDLARERLHPDDVSAFKRAEERAREGENVEFAHRLLMPDGSTKYLQIVSRAIRDEAGQVFEYVGAVRDITEQKRAERALRRARVREIESQYNAMMEERTRLAREIHDTVLQGFNGVTLMLLAAAGKVKSPPETVASLQHVLDLAEKTLGDARRVVWDLRGPPPSGDFPSALRAAADDALRGTGVSLDFITRGIPRTMDPKHEAVAFRVLQEAIANTLKHAAASEVRVSLSYLPRAVRLSVRDDGRGFTVDSDFRGYGGHWGLLGMWERASQVAGKLKVRSKPGAGTEISLRLG
jgi:PAS domain S-box-containing protein